MTHVRPGAQVAAETRSQKYAREYMENVERTNAAGVRYMLREEHGELYIHRDILDRDLRMWVTSERYGPFKDRASARQHMIDTADERAANAARTSDVMLVNEDPVVKALQARVRALEVALDGALRAGLPSCVPAERERLLRDAERVRYPFVPPSGAYC